MILKDLIYEDLWINHSVVPRVFLEVVSREIPEVEHLESCMIFRCLGLKNLKLSYQVVWGI